MGEKSVKREVPPALRSIMDVDVALTNKFCSVFENFMAFRSLQIHYKVLEISCHGIPWLAGWLLFIFVANSASLYQMQVNFYIGLLLDIIIVGVLKAIVRRRRPSANKADMFATIGPDVYSFPSGHATRSTFISAFFIYLVPLPLPVRLPLIAWCSAISISRVLLRRHHLLDVAVGVAIGFLEAALVGILWLGQDASAYLVSVLSDDTSSSFPEE